MRQETGISGTRDHATRLPCTQEVVGLVGEAKVDRGRLRLPGVLTAAILVVIMMALGFLGWVLPSPGGSLIVPTLIVFGVG